MPATLFLEERLLKVLSAAEALPSSTTLYVGLAKKGERKLVKTTEIEECAWTSYARKAWPSGAENVITKHETENAKPAELELNKALELTVPSGTVTQGVAEYLFWADTLSGSGNVWFYEALEKKATIENGTTTKIEFAAGAIKLTVL